MKSKKNKNLVSSHLLPGILIALMPSTQAMEHNTRASDLFRQTGKLSVTLEEMIPENCQQRDEAIRILKSVQLTSIKTDNEEGVQKEVGFSFATTAPWCLLAAKYIKSLDYRPTLGDWGCGYGFFSRHSLLSGANPYAIDSSLATITEANKLIYSTRKFLPVGLNIRELYKAGKASVIKPGSNFMNRRNHINVAFNVIHYLSPSDADQFIANLYENTEDNGIVIISSDTPLDPNKIQIRYYNQNKEAGVKYPGYGVYNISSIVYTDTPTLKHTVVRSVSRLPDDEQEAKKFEMGRMYKGIYPLNPDYDNGQTIRVKKPTSMGNILSGNTRPYCYSTGHQLFNRFDYSGLKNVMELAGFNVLNGWYTDHEIDILYPHDSEEVSTIRASKLVVVAQKPAK